MIGRNLIFGNQDNEWMITFESLSQGQSVDSGLIGGVVGGVVFMLFLVLLIIFGAIIIFLLFSGKQKRYNIISNQHNPEDMIVKMSENTVYINNKSEPLLSQSNPSYIRADDIHIYEEISEKTLESMQLSFLKNFRGLLLCFHF